MAYLDVRQIRKSLGLTQKELSKALGVHWMTASIWEAKPPRRKHPNDLHMKRLRQLVDIKFGRVGRDSEELLPSLGSLGGRVVASQETVAVGPIRILPSSL